MCLNHVGGWFSKTQRDKKFDPGYWIKFLEPPWCEQSKTTPTSSESVCDVRLTPASSAPMRMKD